MRPIRKPSKASTHCCTAKAKVTVFHSLQLDCTWILGSAHSVGWTQRYELEEVAKASEGKPIKASASRLCTSTSTSTLCRAETAVQQSEMVAPPPAKAGQVSLCQNQLWPARRQSCSLFNCQSKCFLTTASQCSVLSALQCSGVDYAQG